MRLKRWESPRKQGRNKKGKLAAARMRQIKKRDVAREAPRSYRKYICYCIKHRKKPDTAILIKLARIAYIAKQIK